MNLYLLRHADAIDHAETDMGRYLSEKGIAQAKVVGKFCRENDIAPESSFPVPIAEPRRPRTSSPKSWKTPRCSSPLFLVPGWSPLPRWRVSRPIPIFTPS